MRHSMRQHIWLVISLLFLFPALVSSEPNKDGQMQDGLYAKMKTSKGEIVLFLDFEKAPLTVANFVGLAEGTIDNEAVPPGDHYYDGLTFHRVVDNFVIQGGDPEGTGRGGPGYNFPDEFNPALRHDKAGIISMANAGPNTNGSQFFITLAPTPNLDDKHSVFGHVVEGLDVVKSVKQGDVIEKVEILRVGDKAQAFKTDTKAFKELISTAKERTAKAAEEANKAKIEVIEKKWPNATVTEDGIRYIIRQAGQGTKPQKGAIVKVHYEGTFLNGQVFDSSIRRGEPIEFPVGTGRVIPGWDIMVMDMTKGEKRTIILPPNMAYGAQGAGGVIPPNAYLVFECELVDF
ncbi:peptidylprolyl isomerase [Spirochaeta cellobiosiphila]|uniref:peptidylprolyl isomerase n=1 Tax=Spirochaeta cellobiosiphila TaxID=504483 RepID=UPI001B7F8D47|nr:peptidylprolyl isomerase [Spirochaeta cellobiosiphila]